MMKRGFILIGAVALAASASAQESPTVGQARAAGLIGERFDGYVGFVSNPSVELRRQVNAVNIRRRALYANLARQKGVTTEEIAVTATCTLFARVPVGGYYQTSGAGWQRRDAGEVPPRPSYCG